MLLVLVVYPLEDCGNVDGGGRDGKVNRCSSICVLLKWTRFVAHVVSNLLFVVPSSLKMLQTQEILNFLLVKSKFE